jgi:hypothetical protein
MAVGVDVGVAVAVDVAVAVAVDVADGVAVGVRARIRSTGTQVGLKKPLVAVR